MPYYVYILQSEVDASFYKGFTQDPIKRFQQHNDGESKYTSTKIPWKMVYVELFESKKEALIREKNLKKATTERIIHLIESSKNIVLNFR